MQFHTPQPLSNNLVSTRASMSWHSPNTSPMFFNLISRKVTFQPKFAISLRYSAIVCRLGALRLIERIPCDHRFPIPKKENTVGLFLGASILISTFRFIKVEISRHMFESTEKINALARSSCSPQASWAFHIRINQLPSVFLGTVDGPEIR